MKHIVIISDVPDTAKEVKEDLEGMGYKVSIVTDHCYVLLDMPESLQ